MIAVPLAQMDLRAVADLQCARPNTAATIIETRGDLGFAPRQLGRGIES